MRALIGNLAGKLGYAASPEAPFAGGTHFDILWQKDEDEVYIEHENRDRGIFSSEIPKLMRVNADLRVLITYTARSKLQSKGNEIVEFILGQLSKKKKVQTFEVLLVIGPRDITGPSEFLAWQFTPTSIYASDALVHP